MTVDPLTRATVLPIWTHPVEPVRMEGGLSNISYFVEHDGQKYVARFGRDLPFHHVSRARELMVARAACEAGFGPEVVHAGPGVVVGVYIDGVTYTAAHVRANIGRIAEMTRRFHEQMPRRIFGPGYLFWVFHVIRDYARMLKEERYRLSDRLPAWLELAEEMERAQIPLPIVFGHNDFIPANIIDDGDRLWFIDYELAGFGTALFDLACLAGNADFTEAHSEELLIAYFGAGLTPELRKSYDAMLCAAVLREAMWGMVSDVHISEFQTDFPAYVRTNLDRLQVVVDRYRSRHGKG